MESSQIGIADADERVLPSGAEMLEEANADLTTIILLRRQCSSPLGSPVELSPLRPWRDDAAPL